MAISSNHYKLPCVQGQLLCPSSLGTCGDITSLGAWVCGTLVSKPSDVVVLGISELGIVTQMVENTGEVTA